jgi:hypothetical protein
MANIFDVRGTTEAAFVNLKRLAAGLQSWPEDIYTWTNFFSRKYGVNTAGIGSKVQVNRLRPLDHPDATTIANFDVAQTRNAIATDDSNLQTLKYDSVDIEVFERGMPKPLAIKKQSLVLAQQDILQHAMIVLQRNRNEYMNVKCRETIRSAVGSEVYGASRSSAAGITDSSADNLSLKIMKEVRRRLVTLQVRPFGGFPNADGQFLTGKYATIIDVNGENQLLSDDLWVTFARYELDQRGKYTQGYVGDAFGFTFYRTDTPATSTGGASGTITCSEAIVLGQDPTLIDPGPDGSQGMVGEFPVVYAQVGPVEVVRAKEDNFERDWITTWFAIEGFAPLEALASADATTLTAKLGSGGAAGTLVTGGSRFVHRIRHSQTM